MPDPVEIYDVWDKLFMVSFGSTVDPNKDKQSTSLLYDRRTQLNYESWPHPIFRLDQVVSESQKMDTELTEHVY